LEEEVLGDLVDVEGHEFVDVVVDVGEVHEGGCMEDGDHSAEHVLSEFGFADGPQLLVLLVQLDVLLAEPVGLQQRSEHNI
jgi:hypothetical protein